MILHINILAMLILLIVIANHKSTNKISIKTIDSVKNIISFGNDGISTSIQRISYNFK
jgi:uncharacterized protein YerC